MTELQEYIQTRSPQAFAALVDRYVNLVYSSALRHVSDRELAADITQNVFTFLAQKAHKVPADRPVSAWLLTTTRYVAMNERRRRDARRKFERTVAAMKQTQSVEPAIDWQALGPLVDEGMSKLRDVDRDVLMLRFFESRSLRDVGTAMGISEEAASKRVTRALEKLRTFFQRRGVTAADVTPAVAMLAGSAAAPEALRATLVAISASTAAKTSAGVISTVTAALTTKAAAVAAAVVICGAGVVAVTRSASATQTAAVRSTATTMAMPAQSAADDAKVRAARDECFPPEVYDVLLAERWRLVAMDRFAGTPIQCQAYAFDSKGMGWLGIAFSDASSGQSVLRLGNTSLNTISGTFTDTGAMLPVDRIRETNPAMYNYRISTHVTEPWPVGEIKKFFLLMQFNEFPPRADGRIPFFMGNGPGLDGIQQLALVTTKHWKLASRSETPAARKEVGEFVIYFWEQRIAATEQFRVNAELVKAGTP